jgi:hypothetical protein
MNNVVFRKEMYHVGVSAHCVEPGAFRTNIVDTNEMCTTLQKAYDSVDPEIRNFYGSGWLEKCKIVMTGLICFSERHETFYSIFFLKKKMKPFG